MVYPGEMTATRRQRTALVVDDEPMVRRVIAAVLEKASLRVRTASNGAEAIRELEAAGTGSVDVVLLDIHMPGLTCAQTLDGLRAIDRDVAVILISGQAEPENAGLGHRCSGFLGKPFLPEALLGAVRRAVPALV